MQLLYLPLETAYNFLHSQPLIMIIAYFCFVAGIIQVGLIIRKWLIMAYQVSVERERLETQIEQDIQDNIYND